MLKRNTVAAISLPAFALATLCLLYPSVAAQAQTPQPAEGAINTTRSNIKNTSRTGAPSGSIKVEVWKVSGSPSDAKAAFRTTTTGLQGQITGLGRLPAGRYELRIILPTDAEGDTRRGTAGSGGERAAVPRTPRGHENVRVTLEGVVGGPLKKEFDLSSSGPATAADREDSTGVRDLGTKIDTAETDLSGKRPGPARYSHIIAFEADGRSEVKVTGITISSSHVEYATP